MGQGRESKRTKRQTQHAAWGNLKGLMQKAINQQLIETIPDISYRTNLKAVF